MTTVTIPVPASSVAVPAQTIPVPASSVTINVPDGASIDAAYRAAGWGPGTSPTPSPTPAVAALCTSDLYGPPLRSDGQWPGWGAHDRPLPTNPAWDWTGGARGGPLVPPPQTCGEAWVQIIDVKGTSNAAVRVHIAKWSVWTTPALAAATFGEGSFGAGRFGAAATWSKWRDIPTVGGALFDYQNYASVGAIKGLGPDATGSSFIFTAGVINHAWDGSWPRVYLPSTVAALHCRCQMWVSSDTGASLSGVQLLAATCIDYYSGPTATTAGAATGMCMPRQKLLTATPQWFTATGMTAAQIGANPPPALI